MPGGAIKTMISLSGMHATVGSSATMNEENTLESSTLLPVSN